MVHCLSGVSVCCILFIHLAHTFIFVIHSTHGSTGQLIHSQWASHPFSSWRDGNWVYWEEMMGIWEITTLQGLKCLWNECSQNSLVWLTLSTSSKTKKLLANLSSQGKFLWQQCRPWVSYQMCIKDQQNLVIMKIWPAFALLPKWLIGIKHCWMRQLSSHLTSWKKKNNKTTQVFGECRRQFEIFGAQKRDCCFVIHVWGAVVLQGWYASVLWKKISVKH